MPEPIETTLFSKLPINKLLEISKDLNKAVWEKVYFRAKSTSVILNPVCPRGMRSPMNLSLFDLASHKRMLSTYLDDSYIKVDGYPDKKISFGILPKAEGKLRELWQKHESLNKYAKAMPLPSGGELKEIVHQAVLVKIIQEEVKWLTKAIGEFEFEESVKTQEKVKTISHKMIGGFKRNLDGRIYRVDGMEVDSAGNLPEFGGISVEEYLAKCKAKRAADKLLRNAPPIK